MKSNDHLWKIRDDLAREMGRDRMGYFGDDFNTISPKGSPKRQYKGTSWKPRNNPGGGHTSPYSEHVARPGEMAMKDFCAQEGKRLNIKPNSVYRKIIDGVPGYGDLKMRRINTRVIFVTVPKEARP